MIVRVAHVQLNKGVLTILRRGVFATLFTHTVMEGNAHVVSRNRASRNAHKSHFESATLILRLVQAAEVSPLSFCHKFTWICNISTGLLT